MNTGSRWYCSDRNFVKSDEEPNESLLNISIKSGNKGIVLSITTKLLDFPDYYTSECVFFVFLDFKTSEYNVDLLKSMISHLVDYHCENIKSETKFELDREEYKKDVLNFSLDYNNLKTSQ